MKKALIKTVALLLLTVFVFGSASVFAEERNTNTISNLIIDSIVGTVSENYKFGITSEELYKNAIHEMIAEDPKLLEVALQGIYNNLDKHSTYFNSEEFKVFIDEVNGEFCGIGVTIMEFDDGLLVTEVHKGSSAEKAGIKKGDYIISADGEDIRGLDLETARSKIIGKIGTSINIGISRDGESMNFDMVRAVVTTVSGEYQKLDGNIGYIRLSSFDDHSPQFMEKALKDLGDTKAIVLDLRYNPGGALEALRKIAELTLPKGAVMHLEYKDPKNNQAVMNEKGTNKFKFVVLTDSHTASAAEAFAAAVQDYGVGVTVGEQTTGKGTMQNATSLLTGGGYKLTVAEYLSPNKRKINNIGVIPDYEEKIKEVNYSDTYFAKPEYNGVMRQGDESGDVLAFEQRLNALGYAIGVPDRVFNEQTFYAVKKFQEETGLYPYGVLDITTQLKIMEVLHGKRISLDRPLEKAIEIAGDIDKYIKEAKRKRK